jgi:predicted small secreted protein
MTLRLGGDGAITGCTSLENPDLTVSGLTISGSFDAEKVLVASGTAAAPSYTFSGDTDNGLYYAGTNSIGVSTAGTSAIVVDSSQRVLIGDTSVFANANADDLQIGTTSATNVGLTVGSSTQGQIAFADSGDSRAGLIHYQHTDNSMRFYTAGPSNERIRIDNSGSLLVGRTSAYNASPGEVAAFQGDKHGVVIYQSANANYTCLNLRNTYANNSGNNVSGNMITFNDQGGTERGKIAMNGSSTSYITSSDYRLKENVINIADGITRIKQLLPKRFNFIVDANTTVDGFLAHEAQAVVPEAVTGEKDGEEMQGIDHSKLVPLLTAALQEAIAKIETLEQRLTDAGL